MEKQPLVFLDGQGTFCLKQPENYSYLYFPLAGEQGLKSAVTPQLGGDCKLDQNTFVLEPVSAENLHNNRSSRNFWCHVEHAGSWSVTGNSAEQISKRFTQEQDKSELRAGFLWQSVSRTSEKYGLHADITMFVPADDNVELMLVEIENCGSGETAFTPVAAVPIYGRSADNLRDHRHVTSLLHRIRTTEHGVEVTPTLSFDERGHQENDITYFVNGFTGDGGAPESFFPAVDTYLGEGGNFEYPRAVIENRQGLPAGVCVDGKEAVGGIRFSRVVLKPKERASFVILTGAATGREQIAGINEKYGSRQRALLWLEATKHYWDTQRNVSYGTGDEKFNRFMDWTGFQPFLRRIYGCSFLPHHDYGKGGRGWRDLWQDCLALLLMNPDGVRGLLLNNFKGVRFDGTNATIIGARPGEFIADRNNITRVWMDHGVWPCITTMLYINQTGDLSLLEEKVPYFKDRQVMRGTRTDSAWREDVRWQLTEDGAVYEGSVLEHLLVQNLTAFYEVGEHNELRLRGADWNDALDMASERGESVAFTNAYAGNLSLLAECLGRLRETGGKKEIAVHRELLCLLEGNAAVYDSVTGRQQLLDRYCQACRHTISAQTQNVDIGWLAKNLEEKAEWIRWHIRREEWVTDGCANGWFNGYYDNHGRQAEGTAKGGVRMMLTSQVFAVMAGTATDKQVAQIVRSADTYLYRRELGGYRLNTDFGELKTDLGRMFGFAYGEKENGAVFSHMAVMYANALYQRGFAKEGWRALGALYEQAMDFQVSRIYPGIPEYFDGSGRGMYHYLTGAASWYMLTVITQMFGVRGCYGDLLLAPKLLAQQFDARAQAAVTVPFAGRTLRVVYSNETGKEYGDYRIQRVQLAGREAAVTAGEKQVLLAREQIVALTADTVHEITVYLG